MSETSTLERKNIFDAVTQFFITDKWTVNQVEDKPVFSTLHTGENGSYRCFAEAWDNKGEMFIFYSYIGSKIPLKKIQIGSEFINRANYGLNLGNFEIDFSDGEIRYKTSIKMADGELTYKMIGQLIWGNLNTVDQYAPGIMSIIYSDISAEDAIYRIENSEDSEEVSNN
jgi:hypothetical protein